MFCLSSGDTYLSLGISLSCSFVTAYCNWFCCEFFETVVILLAILLPIKSPVAFAALWISHFEEVLNASIADFLALSRSF